MEKREMSGWEAVFVLVAFVPTVLLKSFVLTKVYAIFALNEIFSVNPTIGHWVGVVLLSNLMFAKKSDTETPVQDMISVCISFLLLWLFAVIIGAFM